jgi:glycosyltransferase involved in cell wall biosynthesis
MTHVLYVTTNPNRASSNVPTEGWFRLLCENGLRPVVVCNRDGAFCDWTRSKGIATYIVPLPQPEKLRPWKYLSTLLRLSKIVRKQRIQIVHAIEQTACPLAADLARHCRLPLLVGIHCRVAREFVQWALGGRRTPDRLFFLSNGSREVCRLAVEGIVPQSNWRLLPNGLDIQSMRSDSYAGRRFREEHHLGDGRLIGVASWLRPGKQLEHAVEVLANLKSQGVALVLAGGTAPGEEAYAEQFLNDARAKIGARVRFLGCLENLFGFYNAVDICLNTSREETCSISIMESLACGCPVVGYPSVSVDEQVLPGGGEITPQDDVSALTSVVDRWISDPAKLADARPHARQQAERFDIELLSLQLWQEYERVLAEANRRPKALATAATI